MPSDIVIRIQSAHHGTKRINAKPTDRIAGFIDKVRDEFDLSRSGGWSVYADRSKSTEIVPSKSRTLSSYKIKHGDMVYLSIDSAAHSADVDMTDSSVRFSGSTPLSEAPPPANPAPVTRPGGVNGSVVEDEVDQFLGKQDGRIPREKNDQLCRHGPSGKCIHCIPIEPYDEQYLRSVEPPIKFLSFQTHLRKLTGGVDKGKFVYLENLSCKIKPGCKEHPPWPGGICTKCQPNAVTLNRQKYRHVDYIQFENPFLVERFLNYWRNSGNQRMGFLYGRYEHYKKVPLGIKAVVTAIYEPPQIGTKNSLEMLEDEKQKAVDHVAKKLGLRRLGWIFTDLVALDLQKGTVKHSRGNLDLQDSHFLSAEECITAADFQNRHPNPCKLSPEGHFGSKFVTVVVTGGADNQIHFEGYQVSNQCMALVKDDCLIPTRDAPELGYITESSDKQYVPDVFYKEKDSYGNEVTQLARPLPVEYLLVDLPAAFPMEPAFTFHAGHNIKPFPVENRDTLGDVQDFHTYTLYMAQFVTDQFLEAMSDFHVLIYMATCDLLPLKDHMDSLLEAVKQKDKELAHHWSKTEEWATVEQLMAANAPSPPNSRQSSYTGSNPSPLPPIGAASAGTGGATWTCKHCTFINSMELSACDMCSLPK